ncbi:hypothetical protein HDU88_008321 [Geranomyces variabilis]|nr:hypothetical protein HDU88_008321 [Geranomyces variabilis]
MTSHANRSGKRTSSYTNFTAPPTSDRTTEGQPFAPEPLPYATKSPVSTLRLPATSASPAAGGTSLAEEDGRASADFLTEDVAVETWHGIAFDPKNEWKAVREDLVQARTRDKGKGPATFGPQTAKLIPTDAFKTNEANRCKLNAAVSDLTKIAEFWLLAGGVAIARMIPGGGPAVRFSGRLSRAAIPKMAAGLTWDHLNRAALPRQLHRFSRETIFEGDEPSARQGRHRLLGHPRRSHHHKPTFSPNHGKTTLLRDVCRLATEFRPEDVTMLIDRSDEVRGASAESHSSIPTTVQRKRLQKRKPGQVAMLAWRNFSPQTVIADEIAEKAEAEAMLQASRSARNITYNTISDARAEALDVFEKTRLERRMIDIDGIPKCRSETRNFGPISPAQESEAVKESVTPAGESEGVKQVKICT